MPFRKIDLDFCGFFFSGRRKPNCFEFFNKATEPSPSHSSASVLGLTVNLSWPGISTFRRICIPILICNFDIRERCQSSHVGFVPFSVMSARFSESLSRWTTASARFPFRSTFSVILCLRSWSRRGRLCRLSTLTVIVAEAANISLCTLSFCFPLIAFKADSLPFSSLDQYSCFNSFVSGLKISCPDLLICVALFHGLQLPIPSVSIDLDEFLVRTLPILFGVAWTRLCASCTNFPEHYLRAILS